MSRPVDIYREAKKRGNLPHGLHRAYSSPPTTPNGDEGGIIFYFHPLSPPSRAVNMVARHLGVPLQPRMVDLMKGENKTEEYLRVNPGGQIPTIIDKGFILWESKAILCYLASRYDESGQLYPKDLRQRARVDMFLHLDGSRIFPSIQQYMLPQIMGNEPSNEGLEKAKSSLQLLDKLLDDRKYLVSDHPTIADLSLVCTVTFLETFDNFSLDDFANVQAWVEQLKKELTYYDQANEGFEQVKQMFRERPQMNSN